MNAEMDISNQQGVRYSQGDSSTCLSGVDVTEFNELYGSSVL